MQTIDQYIEQTGLSRATVFNHINAGKLLSYKQNGKTCIFTDEQVKITCPKLQRQIISSKKAEWNREIINAHSQLRAGIEINKQSIIGSILADVRHWQDKGIYIPGYSEKSLYRKISLAKVERKSRDDRGILRNSVLKSNSALEKLLSLAAYFYFGDLKSNNPLYKHGMTVSNISLVCDLVIKHSKENEDYYELAAVPKPTMKRVLCDEFYSRGYKEKHKWLNHFNQWKNSRAKVHGAFTQHIEFMDWIIGDDHKSDIDKVLVWNDARKRYELETCKGWHWIEGKTQKVLSYVIKPGELNSEDLILSLMEALMQYGKPNKGILIDQGIGKSIRFQDFCNRAEVPVEYSKPYEPTHKATIERSFGYIKNEHDTFIKNFVGGNHPEEGRHTSAKLSAETCDITFEQYKKSFDAYINDFYETRERNRTIDNKIIHISIRDLFNSYWRNHDKQDIDLRVLRHAAQFEEIRKYQGGMVNFTRKNTRYSYMPKEALPPAFNNRKYKFYFHPFDLSVIDMYSLCYIEDKTTGWVINRNEFVCTLHNILAAEPEDRRQDVVKFNRQSEKYLKEYVKVQVDTAIIENNISDAVNSQVEEQGKIINIRKRLEKDALNVIKTAMPVNKIKEIVTNPHPIPSPEGEGRDEAAVEFTEEDFKEVDQIVGS